MFGLVKVASDDAEKYASDPDAASLMRARREARRGPMRLPAVKRDESEKTGKRRLCVGPSLSICMLATANDTPVVPMSTPRMLF